MEFKSYEVTELLGSLTDIEKVKAPKVLYVAGDVGLIQQIGPHVGVIGTREPSAQGLQRTTRLVKLLVSQNVVVVSGLAEGIDTQAHKDTIREGGKALTVLGTPLDRFYPRNNKSLQECIMREHLAVSQFPVGHTTQRRDFVQRDFTLALICHIIVVIEAGDGSGTLYAARECLRLGRPLFLLKSITEKQSLQWPQELVMKGAEVLSDDNLPYFLEMVNRFK